ncbi:MAG: hypothetical protein QM541_12520 [Flavobacterium sp.]|nr:hypothetical protein [Flavobacterium sp.]
MKNEKLVLVLSEKKEYPKFIGKRIRLISIASNGNDINNFALEIAKKTGDTVETRYIGPFVHNNQTNKSMTTTSFDNKQIFEVSKGQGVSITLLNDNQKNLISKCCNLFYELEDL